MQHRVHEYARLLLDWNRKLNLTGARSMRELDRHLADAQSLLVLDWSDVRSVIDIGSGGGLPALPLAIHLPQVQFTLLEANRRKAAFLRHAAGTLKTDNVTVAAARAEVLGHDPAYRERFDRALARAAAPPAVLLELALPFVRVDGMLIDEVGPVDPAALEAASRALGGGRPLLQPVTTGSVLLVSKLTPTPARYPRRPGIPERRPLG